MHPLCALQWQEDSKAAIAKAAQELQREGRYRHQFFQTPATVEVNILAKNLSPDSVSVRVQEQRLHVTTRGADGQQDYELDIPLYGQVGARTCTCTVRCGAEEYGAQAVTGLMQKMSSCARNHPSRERKLGCGHPSASSGHAGLNHQDLQGLQFHACCSAEVLPACCLQKGCNRCEGHYRVGQDSP